MKKIQIGGHKKGSEIKGYALVDDEDFEWLNQWKWFCSPDGYVVKNKKMKTIRIHRVIMNTPKEMDTDHINGDRLDNRRNNLRICTRSENLRNGKMKINNMSGFKGVYWDKNKKRWVAQIMYFYKNIYIGCFENKINAAMAYNQKAVELFGKFARLNKI